jgi:glycosyl transferase family 25
MFIDKIFVINLKSRTDRIENIKNLIKNLNIDNKKIELFEAVVGKDIPKDDINNMLSISSLNSLYNESNNHKDIRSKGAIGCYLSHYKIWEKMINHNLNNIIILEDDIGTDANEKELNEYINSIPEDYDIGILSWFSLWFDRLDNPKKNSIINNYWNKYNSVNIFSTGAYLLSKKGAKKLIKNAFPICYQVDAYFNILNYVDKNFIRYVAKESIINQINLGSDIQINCKNCDITEKINLLYNKKNNIETFGNINDNNDDFENNLIKIIIIVIIIIIFIKNK